MLAKPSRLDRDRAKWQRQQVRDKARRARERQEQDQWRRISKAVEARDGGQCRVCRVFTQKPPCDPRLIGQSHHIVYRSAGGSDDLWNLVWICTGCSDAEHVARTIDISGTADDLRIERQR